MRTRSSRILSAAALTLFLFIALSGCGGGGATNQDPRSNFTLMIDWGARTRPTRQQATPLPASGLSLRIKYRAENGDVFDDVINRDAERLESYTQSYTPPFPNGLRVGRADLKFEIYSDFGGQGTLVAQKDFVVTLQRDGTLLDAAGAPLSHIGALDQKVVKVVVQPDQKIPSNARKELDFIAYGRNDQGQEVALLNPSVPAQASVRGAATIQIVSGAEFLEVVPNGDDQGKIAGKVPGDAMATVTVDGVPSAPEKIQVTSAVTVEISAPTNTLARGATLQLSAQVRNTNPGESTAVVWSLPNDVQGSNGTITQTGLYTAPNIAGDYIIRATSFFTNQAVAEFRVSVRSSIVVSVAPSTATLQANSVPGLRPDQIQVQFSAAVSNTLNTGVVWSVVEPDGGTITQTGLYTAPARPGTYTVRATSVVDDQALGRATVTVQGSNTNVIVQ